MQNGNQLPVSETIERRKKLFRFAESGDWEKAQLIYDQYQEEVNATLGTGGETALHIAALAGNKKFFTEVLQRMDLDGLRKLDSDDNSALCLAAITGMEELVKAIVEELVRRQNGSIELPQDGPRALYKAARSGCVEVVKCLYAAFKDTLSDKDRRDLLIALIDSDMFGVASQLINDQDENDNWKRTVFTEDTHQNTVLLAMARNAYWENANIYEASELLIRIILLGERLPTKEMFGDGWQPLFIAAQYGNAAFIQSLKDYYPEIVTKVNNERHTIFHVAIIYRQEEVFNLIHKIGSLKKKMVVSCIDDHGNNMLHLVARLGPLRPLQMKAGPFQHQRQEVLWYEKVTKVVGPTLARARNSDVNPKTPSKIFEESHLELMNNGEKLLRNISNYHMLIAILVSTVSFAAVYTVPGGYNQETGIPLLSNQKYFKWFTWALVLSFVFSTTSLLTFLRLLTSSYTLKDFSSNIPKVLTLGRAQLTYSIYWMLGCFFAAMLVAGIIRGVLLPIILMILGVLATAHTIFLVMDDFSWI